MCLRTTSTAVSIGIISHSAGGIDSADAETHISRVKSAESNFFICVVIRIELMDLEKIEEDE